MVADDRDDVYRTFGERVNMAPQELEEWLQTHQSRAVGDSNDGGESTGHASGRRIVAIKRKLKADWSDDDYAHMRKVNGYIARHCAQRPSGDIADTPWRHSLMNWGHDPLKD